MPAVVAVVRRVCAPWPERAVVLLSGVSFQKISRKSQEVELGGPGSGRRGASRLTIEGCRFLDANELSRKGCLNDGWSGYWLWQRNEETAAAVQLMASSGAITLEYQYSKGQGTPGPVTQRIGLVQRPGRYGGIRSYFVCPGALQVCGRHVVRLYGGGRLFLCRHCYGLRYSSQYEGDWYRSLRRANKVRLGLGGQPGLDRPFPARPRHMWRKTYERLQVKALEAEMRSDELLLGRARRLQSQAKKKPRG